MTIKRLITCGSLFFSLFLPMAPFLLADSEFHSLKGLQSDGEIITDYSQFGAFENIGLHSFKYVLSDREKLAEAVGAGIYPNLKGVERDPRYRFHLSRGHLEGALDQFAPDRDPELAYYKWGAMKGVPFQGLRMFNLAISLELLGFPKRALNAYYAIVLHFPREIAWVNNKPWYVSVSALDSVYRLLEKNSEWGLRLEGADIFVENGFDKKGTNDRFLTNPGVFVRKPVERVDTEPMGDEVYSLGRGEVRIAKLSNGHWQLKVKDEPYLIRGVCYSPSPVGRSPDFDGYRPHSDWMTADDNNNGKIDSPYDSWVDENHNNQLDPTEKPVGDFQLLKDMGANTIRLYHHAENKEMLRDLAKQYGIRVLIGDLIGAYTIGSGADWEEGTNYSDPVQLQNMRKSVREMVLTHKNEPYVLMWVLGNENNYGNNNNASKDPASYYTFVDSLARMIKKMDPNHPVALCNGELDNLDLLTELCPNVDVLGINAYRGEHGMGDSFWKALKTVWRKPAFISEFGAPAFNQVQSVEQAEAFQARYLVAGWNELEKHSVGYRVGNCIGGVVFSWMDEWWKAGSQHEPWVHDQVPQSKGPYPGGSMYEEWLGLSSQGDGESSPFLRQLRPSYFAFKEGPWKKPLPFMDMSVSNWQTPN